jgi:hypothetical protein
VLLAAAALALVSAPARAQVSTSAPIIVKVKKPKVHLLKYEGEVVHADARQIVLHDPGDPRYIHTFTYSAKVKDQMEKILSRGGYQYGDRVQIRYQAGSDVAEKIAGKPSKSP